jgi:predicted transcriptional regulator
LEIAQMFSTGASYKEIARDLGIAPTTARHHLREIYRKLGVSDKAALAHKLLAQNDSEIVLDGHSHFEELPGALSAFGDVKPV